MLVEVAHLGDTLQLYVGIVDAHRLRLVRGVIESNGTCGALQRLDVLDEDIGSVLQVMLGHVSLQHEGILVQGDEFLVAEQCHSLGRQRAHVATDEQWRGHDAPHTEVCLVLLGRQCASHLKHVHVVVTPVVAVGREIETLVDDAAHRGPGAVDIHAHAPRGGHVVHPRSGVVPSAHVESQSLLARLLHGLMDGRVAFLGVEAVALAVLWHVGSAVIDLDEVEVQFLEEEVAVLLVVAVEPHVMGYGVAPVVVAAGVGARIRVYTRLQAQSVDVVHHALQSPWEAHGVYEQLSRLGIASSEISVIDVDVPVACILEGGAGHHVCLSHDDGVADVEGKGVP